MSTPTGGQHDIPAADALSALAAAKWLMMSDGTPRPLPSDLAGQPLLANVLVLDSSGNVTGYDLASLVTLIGASLPAVAADLAAHAAALTPLEAVAKSLPLIVSHSDDVHAALTQGQTAIGQAVAAVQAAAQSVSSVAAAAFTAAAQANSRTISLDQRETALEARTPRMYRAVGNLPTLAINGTSPVTCAWTSTVPSPLPAVEQCQVAIGSGGSATPTVTAVSATGVTVSLKATTALLAASGAVQVLAVTW